MNCIYINNKNHYLLPSEMQAEIEAGRTVTALTIGNNGNAGSRHPGLHEMLIVQMYTRLCEGYGEEVPEMVFGL